MRFSIALTIGRWNTPHVQKIVSETGELFAFRICLGWPAITFYKVDIDSFINYLLTKK